MASHSKKGAIHYREIRMILGEWMLDGWTQHIYTHPYILMHAYLRKFIKMRYKYFCFVSKINSAVSGRKSKMVVT